MTYKINPKWDSNIKVDSNANKNTYVDANGKTYINMSGEEFANNKDAQQVFLDNIRKNKSEKKINEAIKDVQQDERIAQQSQAWWSPYSLWKDDVAIEKNVNQSTTPTAQIYGWVDANKQLAVPGKATNTAKKSNIWNAAASKIKDFGNNAKQWVKDNKGKAAILWSLGLWWLLYWLSWSNSGNGSTETGGNGGNWGNSGSGTTVNRTPITATDYPEIVRQVIRGEFGNGQARKNALAQAGYDYNQVQSLVNDAMARKPYNGNQITQPTQNNSSAYSPLSSANDYQNYNEYLNNLSQRQQSWYIDPNGQWHEGMSQNDFNQSYRSWQMDIFNDRRNQVFNSESGETTDQAFWRILNDANQNPEKYDEQKMGYLRQMAELLGYMDANGNSADESGYAIDMSFANPMSADEFNAVHVPQAAADQAVQANNYKNSINNASRNNNYPNGHWMMSNDMANTQGANAQEYNKRFFL